MSFAPQAAPTESLASAETQQTALVPGYVQPAEGTETQTPQAVRQEPFDIYRPDGTLHTRIQPDRLNDVILEKDSYATRLKQENDALAARLQQLQASQAQQAAPRDPGADRQQTYNQLYATAYSQLVSQGVDSGSAKDLAVAQASTQLHAIDIIDQRNKAEYEALRKDMDRRERERQEREHSMRINETVARAEAIRVRDPRFDYTNPRSPAYWVAAAFPEMSPEQHYEMFSSLNGQPQPQHPAHQQTYSPMRAAMGMPQPTAQPPLNGGGNVGQDVAARVEEAIQYQLRHNRWMAGDKAAQDSLRQKLMAEYSGADKRAVVYR